MPDVWVLAEDRVGPAPAGRFYFWRWAPIGPALTREVEEAYKFPSKEEAMHHQAYKFPLTSLEPVGLNTFFVVQPKIIGTAEENEIICESWIGLFGYTLEQAVQRGEEHLDHDDFWVAEVDSNKLVQIWHSAGEKRTEATGEEKTAVVLSLGLDPWE